MPKTRWGVALSVAFLAGVLFACSSSAPPPVVAAPPPPPPADLPGLQGRLARLLEGGGEFRAPKEVDRAVVALLQAAADPRMLEDAAAAVSAAEKKAAATSEDDSAALYTRASADEESARAMVAPRSCPEADKALAEAKTALTAARKEGLQRLGRDPSAVEAVRRRTGEVRQQVMAALGHAARSGKLNLNLDGGKKDPNLVLLAGHGRGAAGDWGTAVPLLAALVRAPVTVATHGGAAQLELSRADLAYQKRLLEEVDAAIKGCDLDVARDRRALLAVVVEAIEKRAGLQADGEVNVRLTGLSEALAASEESCRKAREAAAHPLEESPATRLRGAVADGRLEDAIVMLPSASASERSLLATELGRALAGRGSGRLASGEVDAAVRDVEKAMELAGKDPVVRDAYATVTLALGMAALKSGRSGDATSWLQRSLRGRESGEVRRDLAQLLAQSGDMRGAATHLRQAIRLGMTVDDATRVRVLVVGAVLAGDGRPALEELGSRPGQVASDPASGNLAVHALRLAAYRELAPWLVRAAGRGGRLSSESSCLVFAGSDVTAAPAAASEAMTGAARGGIGLSRDYRFLALGVQGQAGVLVFDAARGRLGRGVRAGLSLGPDTPLAALAAVDVAEAAAPLLCRELGQTLERGASGTQRAEVDRFLRGLVGQVYAYAVLMNPAGGAASSVGFASPPDFRDATSVRAAAVEATEVRPAQYGGQGFLDVASPVSAAGARRGVLRLGVKAQVEALRSVLGAS